MPRHFAFGATVLIVSASTVVWLAAAAPQVQSPVNPQVNQGQVRDPGSRDPNAPPPMRAIPVGSASISGTVTAANGGRPVRDARVQLSGAATVPEGATPQQNGGAAVMNGRGGVVGGLVGGVGGGFSVSRTVTTDANGSFTFTKLPAGHFTINVSKNNFLTTNYGQKRSGAPGATIIVVDGQQAKADVSLMRGGVITGTIYDTDGEPLVRAQVGAWRYTFVSGVRRLSQSNSVSTDDRGVYRLSNLQPADYMVSATANALDAQIAARLNPDASAIEQAIASGAVQPPAAPGLPATVLVPVTPPQAMQQQMQLDMNAAYLPIYSPGTPVRANAQLIHVTGGDEHTNADITVQYVQAGSIQGTMGSPLKQGVTVRLSLLSDDPSENAPTTQLDQNGKFTFRSLAPGRYTVMAQTTAAPQQPTIVNGVVTRGGGPAPQLSNDDRLWGSAVANVEGGSPASVTITLRSGASISGIVVFEMEKPPDLTRTHLNIALNVAAGGPPMMGQPPQGQIEPDGRFTISGVTPGRYSLRANFGGGTMKSSMVNNADTLDFPLDFPATSDVSGALLTITDKISELSGTLTESTGKPGIDYTIIAAAVDNRFWTPNSRRIVTSRSGADGKYSFRALPPGDYYLVVVTDLEQGAQYDPDFLKSLSSVATLVNVNDGAKTTQDLRVR